MSGLEVSCVVSSILSAFNSGFDIFRRMRARGKCKKRQKDEAQHPAELQLQSSLQQRPNEIRAEYNRSVTRLGHRFEIGDTIAQTSLAHTLLVLNTGLINIINNALSDDSKKRESSRRSLLTLSEVAAADALYALSQLDLRLSKPRLTASPQLALPSPTKSADLKAKQRVASKVARKVVDIGNKRPAPSPLLVRGGWIRPKSGSSVVSSASSSKTNLSRPPHQRSKSSPAITKVSMTPPIPVSLMEKKQDNQQPAELNATPAQDSQQRPSRRRTNSNPRPHREPSMLIVSSDFFDSQDQAQHPSEHQNRPVSDPEDQAQPAPPIPPKIPLHSRPDTYHSHRNSDGMRVRPPSVATFMTASTKIGEIPEHRWPKHDRTQSRIAQEKESRRPLPYNIPPPLNPAEIERMNHKNRSRGMGFRFWRKSDREAEGAERSSGVLVH